MALRSGPSIAAAGLPGGFLEIQSHEAWGSAQLKPSYCAASVTFEGDELRIWTAQHCYRVGLMDSISLYANVGGEYVKIPLSTADLSAARAIRSGVSTSDPDLSKDMVAVLDGAKHLSKETDSLTKRCLETTASHRSACFTALDLVTFKATPDASALAQSQEAIASLRSKFSSVASADSKVLEGYAEGFDLLSVERKAWSAHSFLGRYKNCLTERNANAYCSDSYIAESKKFLETFLDVDDFTENEFRLKSSASGSGKSVSPFELRSRWQALALKKSEEASAKLVASWKVLSKRKDLYISTNLTEAPDSATALYTATKIEAEPASPDAKEPHETIAVMAEEEPAERTYVLRSPRVEEAQIGFTKGDSGSLLSVGIVPVAVLSHVDGKETSGGAAVIPLPRRQPSKNSTTANSPAQEEPQTEFPREPSSKPSRDPQSTQREPSSSGWSYGEGSTPPSTGSSQSRPQASGGAAPEGAGPQAPECG